MFEIGRAAAPIFLKPPISSISFGVGRRRLHFHSDDKLSGPVGLGPAPEQAAAVSTDAADPPPRFPL